MMAYSQCDSVIGTLQEALIQRPVAFCKACCVDLE